MKKPSAYTQTRIDKYDSITKIVKQLTSCNYEDIGGPLENNIAFIKLKQMANEELGVTGQEAMELMSTVYKKETKMKKPELTAQEAMEMFNAKHITKNENEICHVSDSKPYLYGIWYVANIMYTENSFISLESFTITDLQDVPWKESLRTREQIPDENTPVDTKVYVRESVNDVWSKRHFKQVANNGEFICFENSKSSWTTKVFTYWKYCKIAEENNNA